MTHFALRRRGSIVLSWPGRGARRPVPTGAGSRSCPPAASTPGPTFGRRLPLRPAPRPRPPVDDEIKAAVLAAIDSRQYILGPECKAFEQEFARYLGSKHAVLTSSATAAIWMVLKALGVKADDEVLVPSHTAFPTVEAVFFPGAKPIFVDVDESYTVDLP